MAQSCVFSNNINNMMNNIGDNCNINNIRNTNQNIMSNNGNVFNNINNNAFINNKKFAK